MEMEDCDQIIHELLGSMKRFLDRPETRSKADIMSFIEKEEDILLGRSIARSLIGLMNKRHWTVTDYDSGVVVEDLDGNDLYDIAETLRNRLDITVYFAVRPELMYIDINSTTAQTMINYIDTQMLQSSISPYDSLY